MSTDTTEEQAQAQDHPPSWAAQFSEDLGPNIFQDQPAPPGPKSSASRHAGKVKQGEHDARHRRNMLDLEASARRQRDEQAHEEVLRRISAGQDVSPKLAEAAMRYQHALGAARLTSAGQLSARVMDRMRRVGPEQAEAERQAGRS